MLSSSRTRWFAFAALSGGMLGAAATHAVEAGKAASPDAPITAIWKVQQIEFTYASPNIRYACESLQKRIPQILKAVGAYERMVVEVKNCRRQEQVHHAEVRVTLAMPVEATEENVRAAVDFDSRDELGARLREERLPTAEDVERFPATWRTVTLSGSGSIRLSAGDCDLMRVLRDHVFPQINVRTAGSGMNCGAGPDTRLAPRMRVNALMPEKTPDKTPGKT
jgi:hypothetical protein